MPSFELIQQFQKQIGLGREKFLQALENSRGSQNEKVTAFYKQLLAQLVDEMQNGNIDPSDAERWMRERIAEAVRNDEITGIMLDAVEDDYQRISQYLDETFDLLDRNYNMREAVMLSRGRLGSYIVEGNEAIGDRLAVEIGSLSQIYSRDELYDMIADKVNVTGARVATVADNIIRGYDTEVVDQLADQTGLQLWKYEGTLIEHSRLFCIRLVRLPYCYTKAQIAKMDNGMHLDPFTFRGGYRCRHGWAPGEKGWPGFEKPYPKGGRFVTIPAEGGDMMITVPEG